MKRTFLPIIACVLAVVNAATLTVGLGQNYTTITAAYDAAAAGDTIVVYPGTYAEKLKITKNSITLKGSSYPSLDPSENGVLITASNYATVSGSDDSSATLWVSGDNFKMYNINVTNTAGTADRAVALSATGTSQGFYTCAMIGWQDTLYSHSGTQYYSRCYIEGAVDFIFGVSANAWFQGCTLGLNRPQGIITAQGRKSNATAGYFVFDEAKFVLGTQAPSGVKGTFFLGRPWGDFARVVFQNSDEGNLITAAGWQPFNTNQDLSNVLLAEYSNTNNTGTRVPYARTLSTATPIAAILSKYTTWVDSKYLNMRAL